MTDKEYYFLAGGGKMGELFRAKDWSKTTIGSPDTWPTSLQTMVSVMLESPFAMYIAWGDDYTQLYNEAYTPILGSAKHPEALGLSSKEIFSEAWPAIGPLLDDVMNGNGIRISELMLPLHRNGFTEDCYFDFSYSPIRKEDGNVGGVLVTVIETTEKKRAAEALEKSSIQIAFEATQQVLSRPSVEESEHKLRAVVENAPFAIAVYTGENMIVELANEAIINIWGKGNDVIGKSFQDILPELTGQLVFEQIKNVYKTGKSFHTENTPLDLVVDGKLQTYYFNYSFTPLYDLKGNVYGVMNTGIDLTNLYQAKKKIEESDKRFRNTVKQAPVGITILRGKDHIVEMANETYLKLVDKDESNFIDKPLFDSLPEVKESVAVLLKNVFETGIPYHGNQIPVPIKRNGKLGVFYFDFLYHPLKEIDGEISGIIVTATEVTEKIEAQKKTEQNEKRLNIIIEASELGTWELNLKTKEFTYSQRYLEIVGNFKQYQVLSHQHLMRYLHPEDLPIREEAVKEALILGTLHYETRVIWDDRSIHWVEAKGTVFYDAENNPEKLLGTARDITALKNHQQELEESEKRFRNLVLQSPIPKAILKGSDMVVELANEALLKKIWQKNESEVQGRPIFEIFPELKKQNHERLLNEVFQTGKIHSEYEASLFLKDHDNEHQLYVDFEYAPEFDSNSTISGVRITMIDVTEKVEARKKIEESEIRFRSLTESIPQMIWETDEKGKTLFMSAKWLEYTGIQPQELEDWKKILHPDDYKRNIDVWKHCLATGNVYNCDLRVKNTDGVFRWYTSIGEPIYDHNGKIIKWVGAFTDVQKEKTFAQELENQVISRTKELSQINESLRKSEERYHLMVEEVQDYAIIYLNNEGIIENWNIGAEKIKGYKSEEIIGKSFSAFYTESDKKNNLPQKLLAIAREEGKAIHEGWRMRKNGDYFWASVVITAVHNKKNNVIGFSKFTHDLTEKKKADDQLKQNALELEQKNVELENMNKELQSFTYISSHDLQEPLRKIQTFASQIIDREMQNLSDIGKDKFQRIQNAAHRMQALINDLLTYSRTNIQERVFEKTDLIYIINQVQEDLREELAVKHGIIESGESCQVNIIPFQFRQLLYNLFSNSLKFSLPHIPVHIKVTSRIVAGKELNIARISKEKKYCHIKIKDNGIGFSPEYNAKIFEVFQRLHGKNEYQGTGIGLAIVKKIVENHNGIITANGELNKGAVFDIYIPMQH